MLEIETRMSEIDKKITEIQEELAKEPVVETEEEIASEEVKVEELEKEVVALTEERSALVEKQNTLKEEAEKRQKELDAIANQTVITEIIEERKGEIKMEDNRKEYRNAFLKTLMGQKLNETEERAFALAGVDGVLPEETNSEIIKKVAKYAPMLGEVTLLNVRGAVKFAVEGTKTIGALHTENASIDGDSDTLVTVSLGGYEVTKLVQVSKSVETMSVASFEAWLTDMIAEMIGAKIEDQIFNGTGTDEAKGINAITWVGGTNAVEVAKDAAIDADDVRSLVGLLPAGYDNGAKLYMRKATLFNRIMGLQDNAKHDLVREVNGVFYVYGYEVKLSDKAPANEIILGNAKKYVANLAEQINVVKQFDINTNSNKYLGAAMFDGKPAVEEAFVKLVQLTA